MSTLLAPHQVENRNLDGWVTTKEAAKWLRLTQRRVQSLCAEGQIPFRRTGSQRQGRILVHWGTILTRVREEPMN